MNLADGKIISSEECDKVLESLDERIIQTLSKLPPRWDTPLSPDIVINACDRLVSSMDESFYLSAMAELGIPEELGISYISEARRMFSGDALRYRMEIEFGTEWNKRLSYVPLFGNNTVTEYISPVGVLFHVAAGNADGLPAFSVLEGLLTGNINILKLPSEEGGASVRLLLELIKIEPSLAEYIYVFDYSSKDIVNIKKLIEVSDAVVVWGGSGAVSAFRAMIPANIKIIEWGHKISFAYVTKEGMTEENLTGLAYNIVSTGQLLCSSCQGIYLDTDSMDDVYNFCEIFLPILEREVSKSMKNIDIGIKTQTALMLYNAELETIYNGNRIFKGSGCSITACHDDSLEVSLQFANAWVKPLPKSKLIKVLRPYKNYLQTAALLCGVEDKEMLLELLLRTGVVRVCSGELMSSTYSGAPHDGEYPLRRYTRTVSIDGI